MKNIRFIYVLGLIILSYPSISQDRQFAWTYQTGTLSKGSVDIEPLLTFSSGRKQFYNRLKTRLEFEMGLTDRLQTAFYLNAKHEAKATTDVDENITGIVKKSEFSISNEWKLNLLNPSVSAIGFAIYGEYTLLPHEIELEYKLLFEKKTEKNIFAFNHVAEFEFEYEYKAPDLAKGEKKGEIELEKEIVLEHDLAWMYLVKPNFGIGIESRNHSDIVESELEHSVFFAGPSVFYANAGSEKSNFFIIFNIMPQLFNLKSGNSGKIGRLDLEGHEKVEARVLVGVSF